MIYEKLKETNKCVTTQCMHKKIYIAHQMKKQDTNTNTKTQPGREGGLLPLSIYQ